tara:strand:- start:966 stop:2468 length:1503 start_codon:yes stop_codon:yes gene_type:complete
MPLKNKVIQKGGFFPNEDVCPVCWSNLDELYNNEPTNPYVAKFTCGHLTCSECAQNLGNKCPECRDTQTLDNLFVINSKEQYQVYKKKYNEKAAEWSDFVSKGLKFSVNDRGELIIPEGVTSLNVPVSLIGTFTSVRIPKSVERIEDYCFTIRDDYMFKNKELKSVTFEEGSLLTEIGNGSFFRCSSLESVHIPKSVKTLGNYSFKLCLKLKSVFFEEGSKLEYLGRGWFSHCVILESIKIPKLVKYLGDKCFENCKNLKSITFEKNSTLENIHELAFGSCENLQSITIPKSVKEIGERCFIKCHKLSSITFEKGIDVKFKKNDNDQSSFENSLKKIICDKKFIELLKKKSPTEYKHFMWLKDNKNLKFYTHDEQKQHIIATKLQARFRGHKARKTLKKQRNAATKIQSKIRGQQARKTLKKQHNAATKMQARFRGHQARKTKKNKNKSRLSSRSRSSSRSSPSPRPRSRSNSRSSPRSSSSSSSQSNSNNEMRFFSQVM